MPLFRKPTGDTPATTQAPAAQPTDAPPIVRIRKGESHQLANTSGGKYTLVTRWGEKDYDLYALVEYTDGRVETVSTFGTVGNKRGYSPRTKDGAVVHVSGDKAASGRPGDDQPYEVIHVNLHPGIKSVVPVVYSAKKSGVGSFHEYRVSTFVMPGLHDNPDTGRPEIAVDAVDANRDRHVYTFVPGVIHNSATGATVEALELYSERGSELRPIVSNGRVTMDKGPENSDKS